jgi:hypothetical protein
MIADPRGFFASEDPLAPTPFLYDPSSGRVFAPALFQALRGIWDTDGREIVVEIDQETGELMACTLEGEPVDPCEVVTRGTQLRSFKPHPLRK